MFGITIRKLRLPHLVITRRLVRERENVVITPTDHITVTPLHQKEFGFLVSLDGPEDLGLPIAPGLMIVRIKHLLTTTAENLKVNGKRVERLMNASKLMSSHV